jgi:hypothetical protein
MSAEDAEAMVGRTWSVQYMAPGILCAFAGAMLPDTHTAQRKGDYTHAVRFRYGSMQVRSMYICISTG